MSKGKLSTKERAFVTAFLGPAKGNATEAAVLSGYGKNRKTARTLGARLLAKVGIKEAVNARQEKREQLVDMTNEQIDSALLTIARDWNELGIVRVSAYKEINKCRGRHSSTLHIRATLEEAIVNTKAPAK
jgi:phage terminase small subunit